MRDQLSTASMLILCLAGGSRSIAAQVPPTVPAQQPPPATKLEAFQPEAGSVVTMGYTELGRVGGGLSGSSVSVDVRELRAGGSSVARGLVVEVTQSEYRQERAFVDADEIAELVKGVDALLEVAGNPTSFEKFEVTYGDAQAVILPRYALSSLLQTSAKMISVPLEGHRPVAGRMLSATTTMGSREAHASQACSKAYQSPLASARKG